MQRPGNRLSGESWWSSLIGKGTELVSDLSEIEAEDGIQSTLGLSSCKIHRSDPFSPSASPNDGCDDLSIGVLYRVLPDEEISREGLLRVIDDSGEDYLYSAGLFMAVTDPPDGGRTFAEILAPVHEELHESGMTAEELNAMFKAAHAESRAERRRGKGGTR